MNINSINNCCKPKRFSNFQGNLNKPEQSERVRYKHLEMACDEVLISNSIMQAREQVDKSGKMRLFKSIPALTAGIIATSIAVTQPGKLSSKVNCGLGFLALAGAVDAASDAFSKKHPENTDDTNFFAGFGAVSAGLIGLNMALKGASNVKAFDGVKNFISNEANKLSKEINSTKLATLSDKYIQPVLKKHPNGSKAVRLAASAAACVGNFVLQNKLADSLKQDIKTKSEENYLNAKQVQQAAREQFNSIEALEV